MEGRRKDGLGFGCSNTKIGKSETNFLNDLLYRLLVYGRGKVFTSELTKLSRITLGMEQIPDDRCASLIALIYKTSVFYVKTTASHKNCCEYSLRLSSTHKRSVRIKAVSDSIGDVLTKFPLCDKS